MSGQSYLPGLSTPARGRGPHCRYCREPITFLRLEDGTQVRVDRRPSRLNGKVVFIGGVATLLSTGEALAARDSGQPVYALHQEMCTGARRPFARPAPDRPRRPRITRPSPVGEQQTLEVLR